MLGTHSDNNVKLIVLDKLADLQQKHPEVREAAGWAGAAESEKWGDVDGWLAGGREGAEPSEELASWPRCKNAGEEGRDAERQHAAPAQSLICYPLGQGAGGRRMER